MAQRGKKNHYVSILGNFRHVESRETTHAFKIFRVLCSAHLSEQPQPLNSNDEAGDQLPGILIFNQPYLKHEILTPGR